MRLSVILKALADTGATAEQIVAVVQAHEAEIEAHESERRAKAAERKRRQRSRDVTGTERDNAGQSVTSPPPCSPPSLSPEPPNSPPPIIPPHSAPPGEISIAAEPADEPQPPKSTPRTELRKVLDEEHAAAVIEHRKRKRSPLTPYAAKLLAGKLAKHPLGANAAADLMIEKGWQSIEPDWGSTSGASPPASSSSAVLKQFRAVK